MGRGADAALSLLETMGKNMMSRGENSVGVQMKLSESDEFAGLVQRAAVQIGSLRRTLEEAAESDRLVRERVEELSRRLEQGERFNAEMDVRLAGATGAVTILEKTTAGLRALEGLIARVHRAKEEWEQSWSLRLDTERAAFEARLLAQDHALERQLAASVQRMDTVSAALDRKAAAVQARCALALDQTEERIEQLERRAADLSGPTLDEFERLFTRAQSLIGNGGHGGAAIEGSLSHAVSAAELAVTECNDAAVRLNALIGHSVPAREALEAVTQVAVARSELLDRCMNQATEQARSLVTIVKDVMPLLERAEGKRTVRAAA